MSIWQVFARTWRSQPIVQLSTLSVLIGAYAVIAASVLIEHNFQSVLTRWGTEVKVNVYLEESADDAVISRVEQEMQDSGLFESSSLIGKDEALVRFKKHLGALSPNLGQGADFENPLPRSIESILHRESGMQAFEKLVELAENIGLISGVEEVSYGQGWIENYSAALRVFSITSWTLILILVAGSLFIVSNAIKSSIFFRRDEIEIMELFGATKNAIRMPYVVEGALMGFLGSSVALIVVAAIFFWQKSYFVEGLQFWNLKNSISFLTPLSIFMIVLGSSASSALGAYLCVRQVASGWAAAENA